MYAAVVSFTFEFSTDNSRLDDDSLIVTTAPTFALNFSWIKPTFFQTACCELSFFAASLISFMATEFSELLKDADSSFPLLLHRPDSTQKAPIGMRPDLGG